MTKYARKNWKNALKLQLCYNFIRFRNKSCHKLKTLLKYQKPLILFKNLKESNCPGRTFSSFPLYPSCNLLFTNMQSSKNRGFIEVKFVKSREFPLNTLFI